ncbi:MAG TPA: hypothetical protein VGR37_06935 [Longimicrobiaceae bacterium]|nr:hypothetical protein [Longimicrobiaceae bacterium]
MEPRSNERHRQTGEPVVPRDDRRLSAEEARERSVENENTPGAVQVRQNAGRRPPSEVREDEAER